MDVLHSLTGVLHGEESFLVDVCGFDRVDLIFKHGDLSGGLFKGVFVGLLSFKGCSRGYSSSDVSL